MRLLIISGLPGSGKSTLARRLARRYGVPLLSKDLIKEPLLDVLGAGDAAYSRQLSDASFAVLAAVTREVLAADRDVIAEGNFRPGDHEQMFAAIPSLQILQVLCRIASATRLARLEQRREAGGRHAGHGDGVHADLSGDAFLALAGERVTFDSTEVGDPRQLDVIDRCWQRI